MIDVIVALGLLALTLLMMFVVTVLGTSPPGPDGIAKPDQCIICEEQGWTDAVGRKPVCRSCTVEYFPCK